MLLRSCPMSRKFEAEAERTRCWATFPFHVRFPSLLLESVPFDISFSHERNDDQAMRSANGQS